MTNIVERMVKIVEGNLNTEPHYVATQLESLLLEHPEHAETIEPTLELARGLAQSHDDWSRHLDKGKFFKEEYDGPDMSESGHNWFFD